MKTFKYIISAFVISLGLSSCNWLDKEPDTELTLEMVFNDKTRVEGWLGNVYSGIPDPYMGMGRYIGQDIFGDDMTPSERWRQWDWDVIPFILGEWTPSSYWSGNYWEYLPQRIREAYVFIENVKPLPEQNLPYEEVEYMKAECRFLAAYYWYLLTDTYGPVPYRPGFIASVDSDIESLKVPRSPYYDIIDDLDKEFLSLSEILPATYSDGRKYGRATSIMCLAIRARMLLFAASPLVNGNEDYADYLNNDGQPLFSTAYDADRWTRAKDACKLLIDKAEAAGHKLYVTEDNDPFLSCQGALMKRYDEGNKEILFARPGGCDYVDYEKHCTPVIGGGNGGWGVTQSLVDAFFMRNGLPIGDSRSGYVESGFSTSDDVRSSEWEQASNGGCTTAAGTYNMYCNREPRFYLAVSFHNGWFPGEKRRFNLFNKGEDNPHTHDAPQNGYLLRKKVSPETNVKEGKFQYRPGVICRLAEAYLNYAEALNEAGGPVQECLDYVNKVRARAGIRQYTFGPDDDNFIHVDQTKEAVRGIIRMERRVELCCEGLRYNDLRRWKEAMSVLNGPFYGMNYSGTNASSFFVRTPYQTRVYKQSYYWFPIHQNEIFKNENLVQSPFWTSGE